MKPEDPPSEGQAANRPGDLLKSLVADKRVLGVLFGIAVLAALVANLGSSSEDLEASLTPTTLDETTGTPVTEAPTETAGHQIPPIDGCTLISDDEIVAALGLPVDTGFFRFSGGEGCVWQPDAGGQAEGLSVELGPGSPSDFETGATMNGATGAPVPNIGDVAVWFGGDGAGVLSVA
jgi:hypothetical protein